MYPAAHAERHGNAADHDRDQAKQDARHDGQGVIRKVAPAAARVGKTDRRRRAIHVRRPSHQLHDIAPPQLGAQAEPQGRAAQQCFFNLPKPPHFIAPCPNHPDDEQSSHGMPESDDMIVSPPAATGEGSSATIKRLTRKQKLAMIRKAEN